MGVYFSREWVLKNVLRLDDEEIKEMKKQIDAEGEEEAEAEEEEAGDQPEPQQFKLSVAPATEPDQQASVPPKQES